MSSDEIQIILSELRDIRQDSKQVAELRGEVHRFIESTNDRCQNHLDDNREIFRRLGLLEQAKSAAWASYTALVAIGGVLAWAVSTLVNFFKTKG